jgi:hypothetical protein
MPQAEIPGRLRSGRRSVAIATGVFLLLAQLGWAVHIHQWFAGPRLSAATVAVDDGLCALCLFHFHSPSAASPAPELRTPFATHELASFANSATFIPSFISRLHVRAPPASL